MNTNATIDYILTVLAGIDDSGNLFDAYPLKSTGELAQAAFADNNILNLCIVTRPDAERIEDSPENLWAHLHTIRIETRRTYTGSASQRAHETLLDSILVAFTNDDRLGGTADSIVEVRLSRNEPQFFYKWLVHYGLIELIVETLD